MRVLVRPKAMAAVSRSRLSAAKTGAANRERQIHDLRRLNLADRSRSDLEQWKRDEAFHRVELATFEDLFLPTLGYDLVEVGDTVDIERMRKDAPDLEFLVDRKLDLIVPDADRTSLSADEAASRLWHLDAIGLTRARRNGMPETGRGVTVAVLDTGVREVPEIAGRVSGAFTIDTANRSLRPQATPTDTQGHGTHVAGLIAGRQVGPAPDANLMSIVILPGGSGSLVDFVIALDLCIRPDIDIVNISAGIAGVVPELEQPLQALTAAGILVCAAIGNEGRDETRSPGNLRPGLSVGASTEDGRVAGFSGSGTIVRNGTTYSAPDLVAPGDQVVSCVMQGGYEAWSGTSMATPIVSAIAALVIERYPSIGVLDLKELIIEHCNSLRSTQRIRQGAGCVQVPFPWE